MRQLIIYIDPQQGFQRCGKIQWEKVLLVADICGEGGWMEVA